MKKNIYTVTSSPFPQDEGLPWSYEEEAFIDWVEEVFCEAYKKDVIPGFSAEEAMEFLRAQKYDVTVKEVSLEVKDNIFHTKVQVGTILLSTEDEPEYGHPIPNTSNEAIKEGVYDCLTELLQNGALSYEVLDQERLTEQEYYEAFYEAMMRRVNGGDLVAETNRMLKERGKLPPKNMEG